MPLGSGTLGQLLLIGAQADMIYQTQTATTTSLNSWVTTNCITSSTCGTYTQDLWITSNSATNFAVLQPPEIVVDEEDLVNHAEYYALARARGVAFRVRTAEERRRQELAAEAARAANALRERQRVAANERARGLLLEHLTPEQRTTFEQNKWFVVVGGKTGKKYRIRDKGDLVANVDALDGERVTHRLCAHAPSGSIPLGDQLLAQKITLEFDEDEFLRKANRHAA
jgi:hypothetical protein